ncbi:hypothetical protein BH20ACT6_BH20ACT6_10430 [soil metagenome]
MTSVLRRLPPLPGEVIAWPPSPQAATMQHGLDLDLAPPVPGTTQPWQSPVRARAARFTLAVIEVVSGDRPVSQLERWMTAGAFDDIAELTAVMNRCSDSEGRAMTERPRLLSVHVTQPAPEVAEVCGHVRQGRRSRAVALRLEERPDGWLCTAVQVG